MPKSGKAARRPRSKPAVGLAGLLRLQGCRLAARGHRQGNGTAQAGAVFFVSNVANKANSFRRLDVPDGFALAEILIAILVLAVGVLGAAGLQLAALRTSQQSAQQSFSTALAAEMADRIRVNVANAAATAIYLAIDYKSGDMPAAASVNCYRQACTPQQIAELDRAEWLARLAEMLPAGRARICRDSAPHDGNRTVWPCDGKGGVVIKIGWQGKSADGTLERDSAASSESPPKLVMVL